MFPGLCITKVLSDQRLCSGACNVVGVFYEVLERR